MYQRCPTCGNLVSPQAHTCPRCGQPLRETAGQQLAGCVWITMGVIGLALAMNFIHSGMGGWTILGIAILIGLVIMSNRQQRL